MGTFVEPRRVPLLFGVVVIPITFLGATYYPWAELTPIPWLKTLVLLNPLVYMSEAMRISLTPQLPHMAPLGGVPGARRLHTGAQLRRHPRLSLPRAHLV